MFKPIEMKEVDLFVLGNDLDKVTNMLYDLKLVEFFEIKNDKFDNFEHTDLGELSGDLLVLRSAITTLKEYYKKDLDSVISNPLEKVQKLKKKELKLTNSLLHIKDEIKRVNILKSLKVTKKESSSGSYVVGFISASKQKNLSLFKKKKIYFRTHRVSDRIYFIAKTKKVDFEFKEFYLPESVGSDLTVKLSKAKEELVKLKDELVDLANKNLRHLQREEISLSKKISTFEAKTKFAKTENIVVLSGFVPLNYIKRLKFSLEKILADKFQFDVKTAKGDVPIKLKNGFLPKQFEALLNMYSLPKYTELDPTFLMFLIFPLFYGFILGDVGYGLLSLFAFTLAKIKLPNLKQFISILQISSISSIIFGVIFGEYFGYEPYHPLMARAESPELLLVFAVIFGLLHINMGIILGFINKISNLKKAVCDHLSWIILELGVVLISLGIYSSSSTSIFVGSVFFTLSLILIYMGHGFIGLIEIPSFFTNILSYARLMAVGLSSVAIAMLVNQYTAVLFSNGFFGIVGGIFLFTFGHIFNIVLGNFESFLHTLRLHYVEFFTKFYTGGGREFKAFGEKVHDYK